MPQTDDKSGAVEPDDVVLLRAEARRLAARLTAVRNVLDGLLEDDTITVSTYNKLIVLATDDGEAG